MSFIIGALPAGAAIEPVAGAIMPASGAMPMSRAIVPVAPMLGAMADGAIVVGAMAEALVMLLVDCILSSGLSHAQMARRRAAKPNFVKCMMEILESVAEWRCARLYAGAWAGFRGFWRYDAAEASRGSAARERSQSIASRSVAVSVNVSKRGRAPFVTVHACANEISSVFPLALCLPV